MAKDETTPTKPTSPAAVNVDAIVARLPAMSDTELATLHANALRLKDSGTAAQRAGAVTLLPAIEAERTKRPPPTRPRPPARKGKTKAKPDKEADDVSEL